jgi:hypothetical protein
MNLALTAKEKQLLRSRKCDSRWILLAAIHQVGFSLTHTPSPMNFLTKTLSRPEMKTVSTNSRRLSG